MAKLLIETFQMKPDPSVLKEWKDRVAAGEPLIVKNVILQRADAKNQNNRIYPYDILKAKCDKYKDVSIAGGNALGELDHSDVPLVSLSNASHVVDDLWWDGPGGKEVMGNIRILNTPKGNIAKEILLSGIPVGISSRALGSVMHNEAQGADIVKEDLEIVAFDLVGTPSTQNSFLRLHEGKEFFINPRKGVMPREIRIQQALKELLKK